MDGRVLICVYCGHEYPQETPAWGNEVLTDHMRKAESDIALLRRALIGLVGIGGDGETLELDQMELAIRTLPCSEADSAVALNAIDALRQTMPNIPSTNKVSP